MPEPEMASGTARFLWEGRGGMFHTSLTTLILIYVAGALATVVVAWIWAEMRRSRQHRRAHENEFLCRICGERFEETSEVEIIHCPRCHAANERDSPGVI